MVVAVRQREIGAHALSKRTAALVLAACHGSRLLDVAPGSVDL
eukprot:CAMPEP_0206578052 /NCGR_PEP_ID=MMETSP0325_2-20121206/31728_1 /ASSEMBLY_ACC=CAM_ASM_000347 /TAXON_ID=2866 /ORGANISM="Crypthecodinium cohnii, Strain Seligo" /LENGTH=42 /DNA_ID= /DNA_START= /DNA_END= /DNA_ORIENTATION=